MKSIIKTSAVILIGASTLFTTGCGKKVSIPSAHVGKVMTKSGMEESFREPSSFRLPFTFAYRPYVVLASVSDKPFEEEMQLYIPQDKLNLVFDVRGTTTISKDKANLTFLFNKVSASDTRESGIKIIEPKVVYTTYAQQSIRSHARSVLTKYSIAEIMSNRDTVSQEIYDAVKADLSGMPIDIVRLGLADIQPPSVIVQAQESAKKREIAIQEAEADKQVRLAEAQASLEVARKQQEVDMLEAETQVMVNNKLAEGVNEAFVVQRQLKIAEALANRMSTNNTWIVSSDIIANPMVMFGATQKMVGGAK